ncbi:MAG: hypothetical protein AAF004_12515, partial [Pseudomonadota bacterium]
MSEPVVSKTKPIFRNAAMASIQTIVAGAILFVLFFYLVRELGLEKFGLWTLLIAATGVGRLGELGLGAGVTKFVAQSLAIDSPDQLEQTLRFAFATIGLVVLILCTAIYFLLPKFIGELIPARLIPLAIQVMPYCLAALALSSVSSIFLS